MTATVDAPVHTNEMKRKQNKFPQNNRSNDHKFIINWAQPNKQHFWIENLRQSGKMHSLRWENERQVNCEFGERHGDKNAKRVNLSMNFILQKCWKRLTIKIRRFCLCRRLYESEFSKRARKLPKTIKWKKSFLSCCFGRREWNERVHDLTF